MNKAQAFWVDGLTCLCGSILYIQVPSTVSSSDILDLSQFFSTFLGKINGHFHASSLFILLSTNGDTPSTNLSMLLMLSQNLMN